MSRRLALAISVIVAASACGRAYTLRLSAGVERTSSGEHSIQVAVTTGFAGHVGGPHYAAGVGRAGIAVRGDAPDPVLGLGLEWLLALERATLRIGPDYFAHRTFDNETVYQALGGRAAALYTFSNELGHEENGLIDELFRRPDPVAAVMPVGSRSMSSDPPSRQVMRRHSIGIEASAGIVVAGTDSHAMYIGLVYENDVLRVAPAARE